MSTRYARVADKELNDKHTRILIELLQRPENKICADCKKKDPRWASWNLGIFVCIRCSGTHRSLGTHISKVKSVDLDTWTSEQIENMIKWGNQRANIYWEASLNGIQPSDYSMDKWIRAKYEQKRWIEKDEKDEEDSPSEVQVNKTNNNNTDSIKLQKEEFFFSENMPKNEPSKEFVLEYQNALRSTIKKESMAVKKTSPVTTPPAVQEKIQTINKSTENKNKVPTVSTTSSGFKMDMSSFQQQLSGLSLGRPSSGLIPQAPPGSNTSWTNFLVDKNNTSSDFKNTSILNEPSTEKPLIPFDALASLRR